MHLLFFKVCWLTRPCLGFILMFEVYRPLLYYANESSRIVAPKHTIFNFYEVDFNADDRVHPATF